MTTHTTVLIGGAGKTGRRVAERLQARGRDIRLASRSTTPAFDWEDRATWAPAFAGAQSAYVTYYPDLAVPGAADAIASLAATALEAGTRRIVLLAGRGEPEAQRAEQALMASGADWTIARAAWFDQNFSESDFAAMLAAGELALPAGRVPEPFVDADDIADVVAAALTEPGHEGKLYELTGPRLMTFAEAVETIAGAAGRDLRYTPITPGEFADGMTAAGVPADIVELLVLLFTETFDGRNASLADGVQQALGRPPRDFTEYARDAAAEGAWVTA